MKNTVNNNIPATLPGLITTPTAKPIDGEFGTAAQIIGFLPFLAGTVDEVFLRNRAREINPRTAAPWIPKPQNNQFAINPTIIALLEWFKIKAEARAEVPAVFDSAQAMANALGVDKKDILWLTRNGAESAQLGGSRLGSVPIFRRAIEISGQVGIGSISGIAGFEEWNKDTELAKKLEQDRIKGERENALADRRIYDLLAVEQRVRTDMLNPLRDALHGLQKKFSRLKKAKSRERVASEIMEKDLPTLLEKLST